MYCEEAKRQCDYAATCTLPHLISVLRSVCGNSRWNVANSLHWTRATAACSCPYGCTGSLFGSAALVLIAVMSSMFVLNYNWDMAEGDRVEVALATEPAFMPLQEGISSP